MTDIAVNRRALLRAALYGAPLLTALCATAAYADDDEAGEAADIVDESAKDDGAKNDDGQDDGSGEGEDAAPAADARAGGNEAESEQD